MAILNFFFFSTLNCIEHVLLWVYLGATLPMVKLLLLSSLPLSCALEHSFLGAGMDANESFGSTNAQLTAGCYISNLSSYAVCVFNGWEEVYIGSHLMMWWAWSFDRCFGPRILALGT